MKIVKLLGIVLLCFFATGSFTYAAEDEQIQLDGISYRVISEGDSETKGEVSVTGAMIKKKTDYSISVPSLIEYNKNSYDVISIDDKAFLGTKIKNVELPEGLQSIGRAAFAECGELKEISIPASCRSIGDVAFFNCSGLKKVEFRQLGEEIEMHIGDASFAYTSIEEIDLISKISEIGRASFYYCGSLKTVNIGDSLGSIGQGSFSFCNMVESVTCTKKNEFFSVKNNFIYSHDKKILIAALSSDSDIEVVKGTEIISDYAFEGNNRIEAISIPKTVKKISETAFIECENLRKIEVTKSNKTFCTVDNMLLTKSKRTLIAAPCVKGEFTIPEYIKHIGAWAFSGNSNITKVYIPKTVGDINMGAFFGCSSLKYVEFASRKTDLYPVSEIALEDGVTKQECGIFKNTIENIEINVPYSKNAFQDNSFEYRLKSHCPETVIITTR